MPFVYNDDGLAETGAVTISALDQARIYSRKIDWPRLRSLELNKVWRWANSLQLFHRMGDSPVSRAFNAWTFQFSGPARDDPAEIFWALMGVEALFNDGREGVRESVFRRSELLLGPRRSHKAALNDMHQVRSLYVHGSLPLPSKSFTYLAMPQYEDHQKKVSKASAIAQALLAASLPALILRNWSAVHFETVVHGTPAPMDIVDDT